jgi:hypothetical protein
MFIALLRAAADEAARMPPAVESSLSDDDGVLASLALAHNDGACVIAHVR